MFYVSINDTRHGSFIEKRNNNNNKKNVSAFQQYPF